MTDYFLASIVPLFIILIITIINSLANRNGKKKAAKNHYMIAVGIEELSKNIEACQIEKVKKQHQQIYEDNDVLFQMYTELFCQCFNLETNSKQAKAFEGIVIYPIRKISEGIMKRACEENHFTEKEGADWTIYKKNKSDYRLSEVSKCVRNVYDDELIGINFSEYKEKCEPQIIYEYKSRVYDTFDALRSIAKIHEKRIEEKTGLLNDMKMEIINGFNNKIDLDVNLNNNIKVG